MDGEIDDARRDYNHCARVTAMKPNLAIAISILVISFSNAQSVRVTVTNPGLECSNEPVVLVWKNIAPRLVGVDLKKLRLTDDHQRSLAFQIDDLDGDGTPDELAFTVDLASRESKSFLLTALADTLAAPLGPLRTDAEDFKRVNGISTLVDDDNGPGTLRGAGLYPFDGVGWESELIAYRLYLDERNAIDLQGKRFPALHWKFIATSGVDYQLDAFWGMDILHIGPALGVGGFGFWVSDSVVRPTHLDHRRCRIIARGPVRAVVRVDYDGWEIGSEKVDVSSLLIIYAGDRATEQRLILRSPGTRTVATGIVKKPAAMTKWDDAAGVLSTLGVQSRADDSLLMALAFDRSTLVRRAENASDHLVLLKLENGKPLRYAIEAIWQGEGSSVWSERYRSESMKRASRTLNEPIRATTE
ncbi:MAG TPA: DUF4861 family protein [Bacteroidota bacterium]|nr:DUF4861 family protein [Bacteroidota bacterium]